MINEAHGNTTVNNYGSNDSSSDRSHADYSRHIPSEYSNRYLAVVDYDGELPPADYDQDAPFADWDQDIPPADSGRCTPPVDYV